MKKKLSIIIPSYNSGGTVENALKEIGVQSLGDWISEIIVVDSSDNPKTKEVLSRYESEKIRVIDAGIKVIPAISRNIGAKNAQGKLLIFIDADAYPAEGWVSSIVRAYEDGCMVGGGCIELADFQKTKPIAWAQYYLQFNEYVCNGQKRVKKFVPTCNIFCDQELFQNIGGFPEIRAAEDVLFGLRVGRIAKLWFLPEAKVFHIFRESWIDFVNNQKLLGKYVYLYRKQHYNSFLYKRGIALVFFPVFMCVKLIRIISRVFQGGFGHIYHFFMALPIFVVGLLFWSIGFVQGCLGGSDKDI